MKEWIKKFCLRIWDKIEDHLAKYIAGVIIAIFVIVSIIFWKWLIAKHSLELYGAVWVIASLAVASLPILLFLLIKRRVNEEIYTDENDIKNILDLWLRRFSTGHRGVRKQRLTINFALCDRINNLKKGSTRKFLPEIIEKDGTYEIESIGEKTIVTVRKGLTIKVGPDSPYGTYL